MSEKNLEERKVKALEGINESLRVFRILFLPLFTALVVTVFLGNFIG